MGTRWVPHQLHCTGSHSKLSLRLNSQLRCPPQRQKTMGKCQRHLFHGGIPCRKDACRVAPGDGVTKRWCKDNAPPGSLTVLFATRLFEGGGRLVIVDGLFDISYGPKDVVLIDGNILHGITGLRDLPGQGKKPLAASLSASPLSYSPRSSASRQCASMATTVACGRRAGWTM